ncbi:MAG: hypothetical protein CMM91_01140 [Rickettsiales bacterium]|nr:hypothetical protein [Rickettsiales bacterium]OUV54821.1 MAG: hypothetical protein CBC87_00580 [Rickettsiales bacterium TMED127]|tara:strand:- start:9924 stop:11213 length:1290 start_codon:yes stop_codon:yes gene_type:complete
MLSREISVLILGEIFKNYSFENSINKNKDYGYLSSREKSFVRMTILTYLRRNGEIDRVIRSYLKKKIKKKFFINVLRIGVTQILYLNVPDYSAVNTSVSIIKKRVPSLTSAINATLRNISRDKEEILKKSSTIYNLPSWIKDNLEKNVGKDNTLAISKVVVNRPYIDIKIRKDVFLKKNWEKILNGRNIFNEIIRKRDLGKVTNLPFFNKGHWWIQSLSSLLPIIIVNNYFKKIEKNRVSVLEIGGAPGGKTLNLCENKYKVTTVEISEKRIKTFKENLSRVGFKVDLIHGDILNINLFRKFNCILIDAPCTASGIIAKKPDILIKNKANILKKLIVKQYDILKKTSTIVEKNGIILYCVCSLISDEGQEQVEKFLFQNKNFSLVKLDEKMVGGVDCLLTKGSITVTPLSLQNEGGLDGFFIACFKRLY